MSGTSRIAYTRIPICDILYTESERGRGKLCGKTGSFFLKKPRKEKIGAHLSLNVWFGKFEHVAKAFKTPSGSEVTVYAETYENEMSVLGNWTTKLLPRPKFSDISGKVCDKHIFRSESFIAMAFRYLYNNSNLFI